MARKGVLRGVNNFLIDINKEMNKHIKNANRQLNLFRKAVIRYEEPYTELSQNANKVLIKIKMPKVKRRDVILKIENNFISVRGDHIKGNKLLKGYYKDIELPKEVVTEKVKASFKNNTLKITMPKKLISV